MDEYPNEMNGLLKCFPPSLHQLIPTLSARLTRRHNRCCAILIEYATPLSSTMFPMSSPVLVIKLGGTAYFSAQIGSLIVLMNKIISVITLGWSLFFEAETFRDVNSDSQFLRLMPHDDGPYRWVSRCGQNIMLYESHFISEKVFCCGFRFFMIFTVLESVRRYIGRKRGLWWPNWGVSWG